MFCTILLKFSHALFDVDLSGASTVNLSKKTEYNSPLDFVYSNEKYIIYWYDKAKKAIEYSMK